MVKNLLEKSIWVAILFLLVGVLYSRKDSKKNTHLLFGIGWIFFGFYWLSLPIGFLETSDYFNALLTFLSSLLAWFVAYLELRYNDKFSEELIYLGKAAGIASLFYFPYHFVSTIQPTLAQEIVAKQTIFVLDFFNLPVSSEGNLIIYNAAKVGVVEITYACTGLGSMALFVGAIIPSKDKLKLRVKTLLVSLFTIYLLNILRNAFVVFATGESLFDGISLLGMEGSFNIAHNVLAKIGSLIALFLIAYYLLIKLPNLQERILDILSIPRKFLKEI
ncbi:archaeosortase A [archaeon SCG-AAA382B04]|nr:archaeosortase A [archaeon SCG-AAA382B04]